MLFLDVLQEVAVTPSGAKFTVVVARKEPIFEDQVKPVPGANGPLDVVWFERWLPERKAEWLFGIGRAIRLGR
jgi:hypothetical protein